MQQIGWELNRSNSTGFMLLVEPSIAIRGVGWDSCNKNNALPLSCKSAQLDTQVRPVEYYTDTLFQGSIPGPLTLECQIRSVSSFPRLHLLAIWLWLYGCR